MPKVSVIIAAYQPKSAFERVVASLDAQTMPQSDFQVVVVDDGSPDDTFEMLRQVASSRPNWVVERIENSGWPSRPRNVGTRIAQGEYVVYMDHDDTLYPEALERAHAYAVATGADIMSPKECKTNDAWWGLLGRDNIDDARPRGGIRVLLPMVPHKMYRREFLLEHDILFPEGRRMLWEDVFFNIEAYRHATRVSAQQADSVFYLWHESDHNNSGTYGPASEEFWDRLDTLYDFIKDTLAGDEWAEARRDMIIHQYRGRTLRRVVKALRDTDPAQLEFVTQRACAQADRVLEDDWEARLSPRYRAYSSLMRAHRIDLVRVLDQALGDVAVRAEALNVRWDQGALRFDSRVRLVPKEGGPAAFEWRDGHLVRILPDELTEHVDPSLLDLSDMMMKLDLRTVVRSRSDCATWILPAELEPSRWAEEVGGIERVAHVVLDPGVAAGGGLLPDGVWDVLSLVGFDGVRFQRKLGVVDGPWPAIVDGRGYDAYRTKKGQLALDTAQELRSLVRDGRPDAGRAQVVGRAVSFPLLGLHVAGSGPLPLRLAAEKTGLFPRPLRRTGADIELVAEIVAAEGEAHVACQPPTVPGRYRLLDVTQARRPLDVRLRVTRSGVAVSR